MTWRLEIYHEDRGLAFGNDHAVGEFLQIWDLKKGRGPDIDNILVDEDKFTGLTKHKVFTLLATHGFAFRELEEAYMQRRTL